MIQGVTDIAKAVESSGYGYVLKLGVNVIQGVTDIAKAVESSGYGYILKLGVNVIQARCNRYS